MGAHYFIFVNEKLNGERTCSWKLYNDTSVEFFSNWNDVVQYCVASKCIPTLLFYEDSSLSKKIKVNRFAIDHDALEML